MLYTLFWFLTLANDFCLFNRTRAYVNIYPRMQACMQWHIQTTRREAIIFIYIYISFFHFYLMRQLFTFRFIIFFLSLGSHGKMNANIEIGTCVLAGKLNFSKFSSKIVSALNKALLSCDPVAHSNSCLCPRISRFNIENIEVMSKFEKFLYGITTCSTYLCVWQITP